MVKRHPLKDIVEWQKKGIPRGICSVCSANGYVIEASMEKAKEDGSYVLIESTSNQVNQLGGYTGMKPEDFRRFVQEIADKVDFPWEKVILGGDHLGPLPWASEDASIAMENAAEMVRQYVAAGFTKIHIDTSMRLGGDSTDESLDPAVIAERGAILCRAAEDAFKELKSKNPDALHPVYVIGSEVPIPGGSQDEEEEMKVTDVCDFRETVDLFKNAFMEYGLDKAWDHVIAVVVQPGVEFGDEIIHDYNREAAKGLCEALKDYPGLVFEGHSTDYQTPEALRQMVEDGVAILKVGPALTFALREGLFMLENIERELLTIHPDIQKSGFSEVLEDAMLKNPANWKKHYHGNEGKLKFSRKFSLSDRARYYLTVPEVRDSLNRLINNLRTVDIPLTLVSQFLPVQYARIRKGILKNDPESLLKDRVKNVLEDYAYAVSR